MKQDDVSATHQPESLSEQDTQNISPNEHPDENKWEAMRVKEEKNTKEKDTSDKHAKDSAINDIREKDADLQSKYHELITQNAELNKQIKSLEQEKSSTKLYHAADLQNAHMQAAKESEKAKARGYERAIQAFIPLDDSLSASLNHKNGTPEQYKEGAEHILNQMQGILEKLEVTVIAPNIGDTFDPHLHTAAGTEFVDQKPDTIVKVFQKGYKLRERMIRPAMVIVSKVKAPKLENE